MRQLSQKILLTIFSFMLSVYSVGAVDVQWSKVSTDAQFNLDSDRALALNVTVCFETFIIGNKNFNYNCARLKSRKHPSKPQNEKIYFVYLPFFNSIKGEKIESRNKILKLVKDIDIKIIDFQEYLENYSYDVDSLFPLGHKLNH